MGGIFSKGSSAPPMPDYSMNQQPDMNAYLGPMMEAMGAMQASSAGLMQQLMQMQMQPPQLPPIPEVNVPEVQRDPEMNWAERHEQLASRMRADYALDTGRRGRLETILTSPLLDDEDAHVTSSVLAGE